MAIHECGETVSFDGDDLYPQRRSEHDDVSDDRPLTEGTTRSLVETDSMAQNCNAIGADDHGIAHFRVSSSRSRDPFRSHRPPAANLDDHHPRTSFPLFLRDETLPFRPRQLTCLASIGDARDIAVPRFEGTRPRFAG